MPASPTANMAMLRGAIAKLRAGHSNRITKVFAIL